MDRGSPIQNGSIMDDDMACKERVVCQYNVVSKDAIVRYMSASHEEVSVADPSVAISLMSASIDGDTFVNDVAITHDKPGLLTMPEDILRIASNGSVGIDRVVATNGCVWPYCNVALENGPVTDA